MSWQNKVHSENFKSNGLTNMLGAILLLVQKVWSASWFTNQNDDTIVLMFVILIRGGVYGSIELNYWFRSHLPDSLPDELLVATTISANVELKTSQECETEITTLFVIFLSSCLDITLIKYLKGLKKVTQKIVPGTGTARRSHCDIHGATAISEIICLCQNKLDVLATETPFLASPFLNALFYKQIARQKRGSRHSKQKSKNHFSIYWRVVSDFIYIHINIWNYGHFRFEMLEMLPVFQQ